jgi:hypothetical protein
MNIDHLSTDHLSPDHLSTDHLSTGLPARDASQPDSLPRRAARRLARGPASLTSPVARWAVTVLAVFGAALMVWSGVLHLQLWSEGYRNIAIIGPLFLAQGIGSIALALLLVGLRRAVLLAAGAVLMVGTAVGLLISASVGLFGFQDSLAIPDATTSLMVEFGGAAVLAVAAIVLAASAQPRRARR